MDIDHFADDDVVIALSTISATFTVVRAGALKKVATRSITGGYRLVTDGVASGFGGFKERKRHFLLSFAQYVQGETPSYRCDRIEA